MRKSYDFSRAKRNLYARRLRSVEALQRGVADVNAARTKSATEAERARRKHRVPR